MKVPPKKMFIIGSKIEFGTSFKSDGSKILAKKAAYSSIGKVFTLIKQFSLLKLSQENIPSLRSIFKALKIRFCKSVWKSFRTYEYFLTIS